MTIYANDNDPHAAHWLSCLPLQIDRVDDRSITDIEGSDLDGFTQCHFFAGIGGWPYALQLAGWSIDRPVWTASCPCQPFSSAGKRKGTKDDRDLWPQLYRLIKERRPPIIFGEQVASSEVVGTQLEADFAVAVRGGNYARANKLAKRLVAAKSFDWRPRWIDRVQADLEAENYTVRYKVLGAHSVGAPHIRQRLFWVAYTNGTGQQVRESIDRRGGKTPGPAQREAAEPSSGVGDTQDDSSWAGRPTEGSQCGRADTGGPNGDGSGLDDPASSRRDRSQQETEGQTWDETRLCVPGERCIESGTVGLQHAEGDGREQRRPEPVRRFAATRRGHGFWRDADYLYCSDGKYRPVEPGAFPLAAGIPGRVAQLRGLGNAIVPQVAATFIRATMEAIEQEQV